MKKKTKIIIITAVVLVVAIIALTVYMIIPKKNIDYSLLDTKVVDLPKYTDTALSSENVVVLGEVNGNQLTYQRDTMAFNVKNSDKPTVFTSGVNITHFAPTGDPESDKGMYTLCQIGYTDFKGVEDVFDTTSTECEITEKALENGIALELSFTDYKISFTLEVWLNEYGIKARIPVDSIKEEDIYGITSITLFPMMGAIKNNPNGFAVFPDGSGSLYKFGKSGNTSPISTFCYFENSFDLDQIDERIYQGQYNVMLPTYGITDGATGVVGYVTEGDENAYITLSPAFSDTGRNRLTASCMYRKSYSYISPSDVEITEVEKNISAVDYGIQYFFIDNTDPSAVSTPAASTVTDTAATDEEAAPVLNIPAVKNGEYITYADMATIIRGYMLDKGLLNNDSNNNEDIKANLQIVMAAKGNSGMDTGLKTLTAFEDVEKIINEVEEDSRENLRVYMLGWQEGGYGLNPSGDKIAGDLGSKSDLADLNKYLTDSKIESYMVADYIYALSDGIGFNKNSQAVYNEMNLPITNGNYTAYLRNSLVELKTYIEDRLPYYKSVNANGVAFEKVGYYLYDDYSSGGKLLRAETAAAMLKTAKVTADEKLDVAVQGGNAYMLSVADAIYDMPEKSSEMVQMEYSIPFYQMIVHGSIPYTGNVSGNMAADYQQQKLKWIEYGSQPNFVLTYNTSELLKNTYAESAFATDYDEHMETVNECIKEFNTKLGFTAKEAMTDHKVLAESVVSVTYEGGNTIYINYNEENVTVNGINIPAEDYVIVEGGSAQ